MNHHTRTVATDGDSDRESVDFRHLAAFQRVYQERNYTTAGQRIFATRKSIVRMMRNLEKGFGCELFSEGFRGELRASPFAERLFNDLRSLNTARQRMKDHVTAVHEQGRILHVGSSATLFRTGGFRALFRELQALDGIRICYVPVESANAAKALISGTCDLYLGGWTGAASRFIHAVAGNIIFRSYRRRDSGGSGRHAASETYVVPLDGQFPELPRDLGHREKCKTLEGVTWLHWLDHPDECPDSTVVFGPDVEVDPKRWEILHDASGNAVSLPIHASFLRQHPYEFLPSLAKRFQHRVTT